MPDYKSMYYRLAAQVADAIDLLIQAQQSAEEKAMEDYQESILLDDSLPHESHK